MNCWDMKRCPEDRKLACPAYPMNGKNCWEVAGTQCNGINQKDLAKKQHQCKSCRVFAEHH